MFEALQGYSDFDLGLLGTDGLTLTALKRQKTRPTLIVGERLKGIGVKGLAEAKQFRSN
ncbi:MAG: hypothetical protein AB4040_17875 [Synechococcus sp.]